MSDGWGQDYGADWADWQEESNAWAADWGTAQTQPMGQGQPWYSSPYGYNPVYGGGYQYAPAYGGIHPYGPLSGLTTQVITTMAEQYGQEAYPELYQPPSLAGPTSAPPTARPSGKGWKAINDWEAYIQQYITQVASETGVNVPGNVVKAIMKIETNGDPNVRNGDAVGLLQITPDAIGAQASENGYDYSKAVADPNYGLYAGIKELALRYLDGRKTNLAFDWSQVADPALSTQYKHYLDYLNEMSTSQPTEGGYTATPGTKQWRAIWGGTDAPITQEFGPTAFAASHAEDWYKFVTAYGLPAGSHPGIDVGVSDGTRLYSPVAGTVTKAGATGYYQDDRFLNQPQTGEFRLKLANGDELILGHMSGIDVHVGDTIQAGQLVGRSGTANGDHVHVEYRHYDPTFNDNGEHMRIVDPRQALSGTYSGVYLGEQAPGYGGVQQPSANSWQAYLQAATMGQPLVIGERQRLATGTFQDYLLQAMGIIEPPTAEAQLPPQYTGGKLTQAGQAAGWDWSLLDQQNANIQAAVEQVAKKTGIQVPANLIKGVMAREGSFGADWRQGGQAMDSRPGEFIQPWNGLTMGAVNSYPGLNWSKVASDRAYAIYAQAYIMATLYKQDAQYGWEGTMTHYLTGSPTGAWDPEHRTETNDYLYGPNGVITHWHNLDSLAQYQQQQQEAKK